MLQLESIEIITGCNNFFLPNNVGSHLPPSYSQSRLLQFHPLKSLTLSLDHSVLGSMIQIPHLRLKIDSNTIFEDPRKAKTTFVLQNH